MTHTSRNILVVEDDAFDAQLSAEALIPVQAAIPGATLTIISNLALALDVVRTRVPPPALIIIDPGLPDMEETISHLPEFEAKAPVVILTGRQKEEVTKRIGRPIEIVNKDEAMRAPKTLFSAIAKAYAWYHRGKYAEQDERIVKLRALCDGSE